MSPHKSAFSSVISRIARCRLPIGCFGTRRGSNGTRSERGVRMHCVRANLFPEWDCALDGYETAVYPHCGVDAVAGSASGIPIMPGVLRRAHEPRFWMGEHWRTSDYSWNPCGKRITMPAKAAPSTAVTMARLVQKYFRLHIVARAKIWCATFFSIPETVSLLHSSA
jgi:hypothetical protein